MQVVLGRKGDYSVRAMLHVARYAGAGRQKARVVAATMEIPNGYATQILANLVAQGLLNATAGPDGGYELARSADDITLLEIVEAAEGPIRLETCVLEGGSCDWREVCPVHEAWSRAQNGMIEELAKTSLGDLERIDRAISQGTYRPSPEAPLHEKRTPRGGENPQT